MSTTVICANRSGIYSNAKVAITRDMIFGLSVYSDTGWRPMNTLAIADVKMVESLIDGDPLFLWKEDLSKALAEAQKAEGINLSEVAVSKQQTPSVISLADTAPSDKDYLAARSSDLAKLKEEMEVSLDGVYHFRSNGNFTYAVAFPGHDQSWQYVLCNTHGQSRQVVGDENSLFAEVLKQYW